MLLCQYREHSIFRLQYKKNQKTKKKKIKRKTKERKKKITYYTVFLNSRNYNNSLERFVMSVVFKNNSIQPKEKLLVACRKVVVPSGNYPKSSLK